MRPFPTPMNEAGRAEAVAVLCGDGGAGDPLFDEVTEIVREAFGVPVALVTLIDSDNSHFIAHAGTDMTVVPKDFSLCAHTFVTRAPLVIPDALADPRWASQPAVVHPPAVRFYAGVPVILSGGFAIGTVCAIDFAPREPPSPEQMRLMERLARIVARAHEIPIEPDAAAAAALAAAQRSAQDEFLMLVSHELRTPLHAVMGVAGLLDPSGRDDDLIEALTHSARHLDAIVENVLAFSEMRSGDMGLDEAEVDVDALLDRALAAAGALARVRGRSLGRGLGRAGRARLDAAKIELAVACLLSNVVMHGGASAVLDAWPRPQGGLVIEISDDGAGIAPDAVAAAFRAFSHAGPLTTRAADGLGLGLPMTRRLVALHGGEVALVRAGSRFVARIELPPYRSA